MMYIQKYKTLLIACVFPVFYASAQQAILDYSLIDYRGTKALTVSPSNETAKYLTDKDARSIYEIKGFSGEAIFTLETKEPVIIKAYSFVSSDDESADPRTFKLESSDNGTSWARIGTSVFSHKFEGRYRFSLIAHSNNIKASRYHRVVVSAVNGGSNLKIAELQLFGYPESPDADLTQTKTVNVAANYPGTSPNVISNLLSNDLNQVYRQDGQKTANIIYTFESPVAISGYSLISGSANNSSSQARSWELSASNDGVNWEMLDIRNNRRVLTTNNNQQIYRIGSSDKKYDWAVYADIMQNKMIEMFWQTYGTGKYLTHSYHINPDSVNRGFNYWWMAHVIDVMADGYERTNDNVYQERMKNIYNGMLSYGRNTYGRNDLWNGYFDDMEWMGLASQRAAKCFLPNSMWNTAFNNASVQLWGWIKNGWNSNNGGGIQWVDSQPWSKNACSNAPAIILAARLYNATGSQEYLDWAKRIFDWMNTNLIFESTGLVKDSYGNEEHSWTLTYNQGTWIGACLELYKITKEQKYYDIAMRTADYAVNDYAKFSPYGILYNNEGGGDGGLFKGIFMRYLSQWILSGELDEERELKFVAYFIENGKSLWESAVSYNNGLVGNKWYERRSDITSTDRKGSGYDASIHLSAVMLFELLDELQRKGFIPEDNVLPAIAANKGKEYQHYRLNITANNGGSNIELARWQLFDSLPATGVNDIYSPQAHVRMVHQPGKVILQKLTDEDMDYSIYQTTGQIVHTGSLSVVHEIVLPQGIYILRLTDKKSNVWSLKFIIGNEN